MRTKKNNTEVSLVEVLLQLKPEGGWTVHYGDDSKGNPETDSETVEWHCAEEDKIADSVLAAKKTELEKLLYQDKRAAEYPDWKEQLDKIYHSIDDWKADIKAIKDKYPKPS